MPEAVGPPPPAGVCAVVVTYGSRWALLEKTLESVLAQPCDRVVVIDNGAHPDVSDRLASAARRDARVEPVRLAENTGSAGGFRAGLVAASRTTCRFVWTLDDDTAPEPGALTALVAQWQALGGVAGPQVRGLLSQRWETDRYIRERDWSVNAAFGVDVWHRLGRRLAPADGRDSGGDQPIRLRMAPWSGLFFERVSLNEVGFPDARLVLYEDDHEFTLRLTAGGGSILLVPASRLATLEPSWHQTTSGGVKSPWVATADRRRAYYAARNRVYVERRCLVTHPVRHAINLVAFTTRVVIAGVATGALDNSRGFLAGVFDGWRGRLGA